MGHFTSVCLLLAPLLWLWCGGKGVPASKQLLGLSPVFSNCELIELSKTNLHNTPPKSCRCQPRGPNVHLHVANVFVIHWKSSLLTKQSAGFFCSQSAEPSQSCLTAFVSKCKHCYIMQRLTTGGKSATPGMSPPFVAVKTHSRTPNKAKRTYV